MCACGCLRVRGLCVCVYGVCVFVCTAPLGLVSYEVLRRPGSPDSVKYRVLRRPGPPDTVNYEAFGLKTVMFELGVYVWRARGRQKRDFGPSGPRG